MARRRFTKEYKQEAVSLVQQSDIPVAEIARNLGINDNMLRRWVKEYADPVKRSFPGINDVPNSQGFNQRLLSMARRWA